MANKPLEEAYKEAVRDLQYVESKIRERREDPPGVWTAGDMRSIYEIRENRERRVDELRKRLIGD